MVMSEVIVRQATIDDVDVLVPLFDAYRQFYRQQSNIEAARQFLLERFRFNQSVVFLAGVTGGAASGFIQLFPSFSSTRLAPIWILNDLFVAPEHRRQGVAQWDERQARPLNYVRM
jgi:GNAT superfamily N-acetyltransferase